MDGTISRDQVSCVIPTFGAAPYLFGAVRSALAQGFREVIIVDDGCRRDKLEEVAGIPGVRVIHLPGNSGGGIARNAGIRSCTTKHVVLLDHDDLLRVGYLDAITRWVSGRGLRCAAGTLRYIGKSPDRIGRLLSRKDDFCLPSGFFCEVSLAGEAGYFPDSLSDDILFFRALRRIAKVTACPGAGVLYRIHPESESSRNSIAWWAINRLLPGYESGSYSLEEINSIAWKFSRDGTIPGELVDVLSGSEAADVRYYSRTSYAAWLDRDLRGIFRSGMKLIPHIPALYRLARDKWGKDA